MLEGRFEAGSAPFGLGRFGEDPWSRLGAAGRFQHARVRGAGHVELMWDVAVHRRLASMMSEHGALVHQQASTPPSSPWSGDAVTRPWSGDAQARPMPTDPLAYAKAAQNRNR